MEQDRIEFLISQYLDGTLSPEERVILQEELEFNPEARQLLEEHRSLDVALRDVEVPQVDWQALSASISNAIASAPLRDVAQTGAISDSLEHRIVQYVDGELPENERQALERDLAGNSVAQRVLTEHRSLEVVLKHAWPLPHVEWDRLAQELSLAIDESEQAQRYSIAYWTRQAARVAVAACVVIGIGLTLYLTRPGPVPQPVVEVAVAEPQRPAGEAVAQVQIGPSEALAASRFDRYGNGGVVARPSRMTIASGYAPAYDGVPTPY